ncbi:uncharacterized protein BN681_00918 [Clostridium sp. CAG:492]|nr:uncharacterized protein BN681_00918 [Clostridium sp. CAG:492]
MKFLNYLVLTLVVIGALNWLLVGAFEFNLVETLFNGFSIVSRIVYILVGIAGIWAISFYNKIGE